MGFVVKSEKPAPDPRKRSFDHCGRMFLSGQFLRVVLDGRGMYDISLNGARVVLLGLGEADVCEAGAPACSGTAVLSESRRGFYLTIGGLIYVTPAERVRNVISGEHRKAPVFQMIPPGQKDQEMSAGN